MEETPIPNSSIDPTMMDPTAEITTENNPPQNKNRKKILIILGSLFVMTIIFASLYVAFLTKRNQNNTEDNVSTAPPPIESNQQDEIDENTTITASEISSKLNRIINDEESEIHINMGGTINEGCRSNASYTSIKSAGNTYALLFSKFDPDTITSCDIDLKEMYFETYWINDNIYYRQYEDKDFEMLDPGSRIAITPELAEMLESIIPSTETIKQINSEKQDSITFEGYVDETTRGEYKILMNTNGDINTIEFNVNDNANQLTNIGTIMISEPETPIQLPASTNIDSSEESDYEGFAN